MHELAISSPQLHDQGSHLSAPPTPSENQAYQQLHRPRPPNYPQEDQVHDKLSHGEHANTQARHLSILPDARTNSVRKRTSRFGLAGFFGRSKGDDGQNRPNKLHAQLEEDGYLSKVEEKDADAVSQKQTAAFPEVIDALPAIQHEDMSLRHKPSKQSLKTKASFKRETEAKTISSWDPPPLFQVYPQAIKYATLKVPLLSAESILRHSLARQSAPDALAGSPTGDGHALRDQKERKLRRNPATDALSKIEWTKRIFVLVTAGYLLQYAGEGPYNRLPEKIMPLTIESAAFASDVIPGQPYVLQISQVLDEKGTVDKEISRSMLKKLGLRSEIRRSTSTFLLVLESPEEMSSWLAAVRKEVQAMGGKDHEPHCVAKTHDDTVENAPLRQRPSQRYLIKREPNKFHDVSLRSPSDAVSSNDLEVHERPLNKIDASSYFATKRQSLATQCSADSRAASNTSASINQAYLDDLRESPRESYASTDAKTCSTSPDNSPRVSPNIVHSEVPEIPLEHKEQRPLRSTYPGAKHTRMQALQDVQGQHQGLSHLERCNAELKHHPSTSKPQPRRTSSPPAPNFSVPSFSKRYSTASTASPVPHAISKAYARPTDTRQESSLPSTKGQSCSTNSWSSAIPSDVHYRHRPTYKASKKILKSEADPFLTPPPPSSSVDVGVSKDGEQRFSRRYSSLQYSSGVSPVLLSQSPSPHPPPTAALPPLPTEKLSLQRASPNPPPSTPLPPLPVKSAQRYSMFPPSLGQKTLPGPRASSSHSEPSAAPEGQPNFKADRDLTDATASSKQSNEPTSPAIGPASDAGPGQRAGRPSKLRFLDPQNQSQATGREVRNDATVDAPPQPSPSLDFLTTFDEEGLTPSTDGSPPKPSREPPPPPTPPKQGQVRLTGRRTSPRIGREPPPVYSPAKSPKSRISVSSSAEGYFDGAAPHPFIPPIRVSERKFRGSLDGPWNPGYGAPQRTFLDLSVS